MIKLKPVVEGDNALLVIRELPLSTNFGNMYETFCGMGFGSPHPYHEWVVVRPLPVVNKESSIIEIH